MIIETRDDVVRVSGSLHKNQWPTIKAAANLLMRDHPEGIIVDCAELTDISEEGARTFLEALRDSEALRSRIVVANLPEKVRATCSTVPGVRSQLLVAESVEAARASLRMAARPGVANVPSAHADRRQGAPVLVPLIAGLDLAYGADLASRLAKPTRSTVRIVYFLVVARTLPIGAPLLELETAAAEALARAEGFARQWPGVTTTRQVERVREPAEGILAAARSLEAGLIVLGATEEPMAGEAHDVFHHLVDTLLHRAACEVVVGRQRIAG